MSRVLAYTSPTPGHAFPPVEMLLELQRRGHEVQMLTLAEAVEPLRAVGLDAVPVDPAIAQIEFDDWRARTRAGNTRRILDLYERRAQLEIPDLRTAIAEYAPDALIVDIQCEGAGFVASASGLPWVKYCPYPLPLRSVDTPLHGSGFRLAEGPLGRMRDRLVLRMGDRLVRSVVAKRNRVRATLGLPAMRTYDEQWLEADRFVAFTAEPFEYPRSDLPGSVRMVGPGTWDPPAEVPNWLDAETRPLVLVVVSTAYQRDSKLISTALAAFADEDVALIATTGAHDPASFAPPPNARLAAFLPHGMLIHRAACVICHGGQGITQKALASGVPVCVVPFLRDQFDVARRVQRVDAGVRLHHRRMSPKRLRAAVSAAITKRPGAEGVAAGFATAGGARSAADALEEVLGESGTARPNARTGA